MARTGRRETPKKSNNLPNSFYYPALDGLRFFAFLFVFLHHALAGASSHNPFINIFLIIIQKNGWVGVDLFFVLSGFLITSLLLRERERFGNYSLKNFWIRRSLRIWPLYYLALFVGFFIVPFISAHLLGSDYSDLKYSRQIQTELPLYLSFLGNWAVVFNGYGYFTNISHLWTISIEEQFYFIWPLILLFITNFKKTLATCFTILIISLLTRLGLALGMVAHPGIYTNTFARMDTLIMGAMLALVIFQKPNFLNLAKRASRTFFVILVFLAFLLFLSKVNVFNPKLIFEVVFGYLVIGLFMVYFLLSAIQQNYFRAFLSFKPFVYLGKISYGLYVWHVMAINIAYQIATRLDSRLFIPLSATLTFIIAFLSYNLFEKMFLKYKEKYSSVSSKPI